MWHMLPSAGQLEQLLPAEKKPMAHSLHKFFFNRSLTVIICDPKHILNSLLRYSLLLLTLTEKFSTASHNCWHIFPETIQTEALLIHKILSHAFRCHFLNTDHTIDPLKKSNSKICYRC